MRQQIKTTLLIFLLASASGVIGYSFGYEAGLVDGEIQEIQAWHQ